MCGIIGYIGRNNAVDIILEGLKRLEYRGYDSAGIAFMEKDETIDLIRCEGKINDLVNKVAMASKAGMTSGESTVGIGHTRWATHGSPVEKNAHPHRSGGIAIVHNGIIENYMALKKELISEGFRFTSDTDTEVICHLVGKFFREGNTFTDAVFKALKRLKGSYAIALINEKEPDKIVCARKDSPLVLGLGGDEYYVASDVPAFLNYTRNVIFMNDGEMAILAREGVTILDWEGNAVHRDPTVITWSASMAEKGGYRHFMLKEIFEQPRAVADTIAGRVNLDKSEVNLYEFGLDEKDFENIGRIFLVGCGTSWHAALCGKYMIEELARIPVEVDIASEFRYRSPLITGRDLFVSISQSGETADTLGAMREAKRAGAKTLAVCNVVGSTASRESDYVFYTHCGPEIGVASTKAFVTQLVSLYLFALALARQRCSREDAGKLIQELLHLPLQVEEVLLHSGLIEGLAEHLFKAKDFLFLARGILYPIALEGALKLKEISYIHAEGYPAGEMKHGPIALIDDDMPVVIVLSKDYLYEKVISNIEEVKSRRGRTVVISNEDDSSVREMADHFFTMPLSNKFLNPIIMTVPLQLLAYHVAVIRGCDVDQPRNLAKSVTVE